MSTRATPIGAEGLKRMALLFVFPALSKLPRAEWGRALKQARAGNFDTIEWLGVMAGVAIVTYFLRFDPEIAATISPAMRFLVQFLTAFPLLVLIVGPFYLRRLRRGLDLELEQRHERRDHKWENEL